MPEDPEGFLPNVSYVVSCRSNGNREGVRNPQRRPETCQKSGRDCSNVVVRMRQWVSEGEKEEVQEEEEEEEEEGDAAGGGDGSRRKEKAEEEEEEEEVEGRSLLLRPDLLTS